MFKNRIDAGKQLAEHLKQFKDQKNTLVLSIPRGGVIVGVEVAKKLNLPHDIVMTKKICAPGNEEFAIGAVHLDGDVVINEKIVKHDEIEKQYIEKETAKKLEKLKKQIAFFRDQKPLLDLKDKTIILVDDGIATGYTIICAANYLRKQHIKELIIASPVAPLDIDLCLEKFIDQIIIVHKPPVFGAVGNFYEDFAEVTDDEVKKILAL